MSGITILVADPLEESGLALLRDIGEVLSVPAGANMDADLGRAAALVVRSRTQVTADVLDRARNLRIVARAGIGVDNIDVPAATARGILVVNAPHAAVRSTAEHAIALLFALARQIPRADASVRAGSWKAGYEGMQLGGKRLGVVGLGKVGRQVVAIASAIGMDVVGHDPYLPAAAWSEIAVPSLPLDELLAGADAVTLHVSLGPSSRHLINAENLSLMRPDALLVNCARGALVDEVALAAALEEGRLGGAACDVFEREPVDDSPLLHAPRTILTPHVAASTREAQERVAVEIAEQIRDFAHGRPVAYPVNPSVSGVLA